MNLDTMLTPGRHRIRMEFEGEVVVEEAEEMTIAEAIDQAYPVASLVNWEVDGK